MDTKTKQITVQLLRIALAIPLSFLSLNYLKLENAAIRIIFFMGIYILVSVLIEILLILIKKIKKRLL